MWCSGDPGTVALRHGGEEVTYLDLALRVGAMARRLEKLPGLLAVRMHNAIGPVLVLVAALELGRPVAVLPAAMGGAESQAMRAILGRATEVDGDGEPVWMQPDAPLLAHPEAALIAFTSGSTGVPRAVQLGRAHLEHNAANVAAMTGMGAIGSQLLFAPLSHLFALFGQLLPALRTGLTTTLLGGIGEARATIERGEAHGMLSGVPAHWETLLRLCRAEPSLYAGVSLLVSSGAPLAAELRRRLLERFGGATILNGYGLSEAPRILAIASGHPDFLAGATGAPTLGAEIALSPQGELLVRGNLVMLGYLGAPAATAERIREGWLHSGDIATVSAGGVYTVQGRIDDMCKVGGERVSLVEIDDALHALPEVEDAAASTEADDIYGARVVAFMVGGPALAARAPAALRDALGKRLGTAKLPARFFLVPALPRNRVGKLMRGELERLRATARELR